MKRQYPKRPTAKTIAQNVRQSRIASSEYERGPVVFEHLLGKGDMLFLPPGSSRLTRVHGLLVTETEIQGVVDFRKEQAQPEYDRSFLIAPPADDEIPADGEPGDRRSGPGVCGIHTFH